MHVFDGKDKTIKMIVPASGVVTALEPVLLACNGTWVANGSGSADREIVDSRDRLRVPPDRPSYTLRRVWLTDEEEKGYYYGFSNEGLWPLCHIAHTRPIFRPEDWLQYQRINQRFADTVLQEMADVDSPILLAQDYHLALVPRMVKEAAAKYPGVTFSVTPAFGIEEKLGEIVLARAGIEASPASTTSS